MFSLALIALPSVLLANAPVNSAPPGTGPAARLTAADSQTIVPLFVHDKNGDLQRWLQVHRAGSGAAAPVVPEVRDGES